MAGFDEGIGVSLVLRAGLLGVCNGAGLWDREATGHILGGNAELLGLEG